MSPASKQQTMKSSTARRTVRDLMTTELVVVEPEVSVRDAMALLSARHISGAPVVAGERLLGVFSANDLVGFAASLPGVPEERSESGDLAELESPEEWEEGDEPPSAYFVDWWADAGADVVERLKDSDQPEWDVLGEHTVGETMTRRICSVAPDTDIVEAARYMTSAGIHRVLVMEHGRLLGILTTMDVVRAVANGRI